jgi:transmembrane sensor
MALDEAVREQAAAWAVRTGDPAFDDWDVFAAWLEEDPEHARAYDSVTVAVLDAAEALPRVRPANNDDEPAGRRRRWIGGAVVSALAVLGALGVWQMRGASYAVETTPGELRVVELEGAGVITLAGGSRLILDRRDPRRASLEQGQALFTIEHDPSTPFRLTVGEDTLVDVGTVFDVEHTAEHMTVAVSEGAVVFNPSQQNVHVAPGQMLTRRRGSAPALAEIPLTQVGEWSEGRLTFRDASLEEIAADLSRATGIRFIANPRAADQAVSGSLLVDTVRSDPRSLGALLGVPVGYNGEAWEIGVP